MDQQETSYEFNKEFIFRRKDFSFKWLFKTTLYLSLLVLEYLSPPFKHNSQGHVFVKYLDDIPLLEETFAICCKNIIAAVELLTVLGFTIHPVIVLAEKVMSPL